METPGLSLSPNTFTRCAVGLIAALRADPKTAALADAMEEANERLRAAGVARTRADELSTAQLSLRHRADYECDKLIRAVDIHALAASDRDRKASPYREVMASGLTAIISAPVKKQLAEMTTLELRVREVPELAHFGDPLAQCRAQLETSIGRYGEAVRAEGQAKTDLHLAKVDWQSQYRKTFGGLLAIFGDEKKANSFFVVLRSSRVTATTTEEETESNE